MIFKHEKKNETLYVHISGILDHENLGEFTNELMLLTNLAFDEAVFNLSNVPFLDSSTVGKFLIFYRSLECTGRSMRIKGAQGHILSTLTAMRLDNLFPIES